MTTSEASHDRTVCRHPRMTSMRREDRAEIKAWTLDEIAPILRRLDRLERAALAASSIIEETNE
jgi:hypothetical protein